MLIAILPAFATGMSGTVVGAEGQALAGVQVVAYDPRFNYATATSTNAGTWSIRQLPAGKYRVRFLPPDDTDAVDRFHGDAWDICDADVVEVGEGKTVEGVDVALPRGGTLAGRLQDSAGNPVPAASVMAKGMSERTSLSARVTMSAADGTFRLVGLDGDAGTPEPYDVQVIVTGWPRQYLGPTYDETEGATWFEVEAGAETDAGTHPLLDGITVIGTVTGPDGPVAGATVYAYASQQVIGTYAEDDGTYVADGLPPGDVITWAGASGLATTYYPDADRPGESVPAPNEGDVATCDLSLPEENTFTAVFSGEGDWEEVSVLLYNSTLTVGRGSGLSADGTVTLRTLHPGDYHLYVYGADAGLRDGFVEDESGERAVFVVEGESVHEVGLPPGAAVSGRVTDDDGRAVYGASVYVFDEAEENVAVGTTDHDGNYVAQGLPAGEYTARAGYVHYCPTDEGFVTKWWESSWTETGASVISLGEGERLADFDFLLPRDDDHDQMGDTWEREHGLDASRDDAAEDPDGDGYSNLEEWQLGSDPRSAAGVGGCSCGGAAGWPAGGLLIALATLRRRVRHARRTCAGSR